MSTARTASKVWLCVASTSQSPALSVAPTPTYPTVMSTTFQQILPSPCVYSASAIRQQAHATPPTGSSQGPYLHIPTHKYHCLYLLHVCPLLVNEGLVWYMYTHQCYSSSKISFSGSGGLVRVGHHTPMITKSL